MIKIMICLLMGGLLLTGCAAQPQQVTPSEQIQPTAEDKASYIKISPEEAKKMMDEQTAVIVDVRTQEEYDEGHIDKAILLPVDTIANYADKLLPDKSATLLVYCRSGNRSKTASEELINLGYKNVYDFGGIIDWPYGVVK